MAYSATRSDCKPAADSERKAPGVPIPNAPPKTTTAFAVFVKGRNALLSLRPTDVAQPVLHLTAVGLSPVW